MKSFKRNKIAAESTIEKLYQSDLKDETEFVSLIRNVLMLDEPSVYHSQIQPVRSVSIWRGRRA